MAERVFIPIPVAAVRQAEEKPSRTYKLDLDKGRILGMIDGREAVRQAIQKAILTPRWKCLIYDNQYGSEIEAAVIQNRDATREYVEAVLPGFVEDCLQPDSRITGVSNFQFAFEDDRVFITFDADTVFGAIRVEEVV